MQKFDELNNIKRTSVDVIPIEQYFDEMDLGKEDKQKRIDMAYKLYDVFSVILALIDIMVVNDSYNRQIVVDTLTSRCKEILVEFEINIDNLNDYVLTKSGYIVDTTYKHITDEYYTSDDRTTILSEEESNSLWNYSEFHDAELLGKTKKTWITMRDRKVRHSHREVDNETIPLAEAFEVGNSLLMFPRDESLGADGCEIANCRCTIKYI